MKLGILVVAAGLVVLPAIAQAQQDTTKKDTTMKAAGDTMTMTTKTTTRRGRRAARAEKGESAATEKRENAKAGAGRSADCPLGCPTSKGAAGLSGVQFLALQQELRDRGCGNAHVTGRLDGATRAAIKKCASQLNVANSAAAVLVAMNIGYGEADVGKTS